MLQPKRTKFRKQFKGRNRGLALVGNAVSFGEYGLKAVSRGRITARQIEAARRAISRHVRRGGKIWIRVFPDKPISKKPLEVRMGKGKGAVEYWVAEIQPGKVLYEMEGVDEAVAREAMALAAAKLAVRTTFVKRGACGMKMAELRGKSAAELNKMLVELHREHLNLRVQRATGQLTQPARFRALRRDVARIKTLLQEQASQASA